MDDDSQEPPEPDAPAPPGDWGEVFAVLAVGVFPNLAWAVADAFAPEANPLPPYWVDSLTLTTRSLCTAFVVLYLLHRGGERWPRFGLVRPGAADLLLAPALVLLWWWIWDARGFLIPPLDLPSTRQWFPLPRQPADYVMMVVKHMANAFAEELVTRAYLVTRLEGLLKSRAAAVLLAAAAFASYHAYQRADGLIDTLLGGIAWGAAYLVVRRLWPFVLAHALWNVLIELR